MSEELHGIFIDVEVYDGVATDPELARKLDEACPVDIFAAVGGRGRASSTRTSTSASSATSASTPPPRAASRHEALRRHRAAPLDEPRRVAPGGQLPCRPR